MRYLESEDQFYELNAQIQPVCFIFSAQWCPDCQYIQPFLQEIIDSHQQFDFVYVDRDQFHDLCLDQDVLGIPSFVVYQNKKEIARFVSRFRKTRTEIEEFLDGIEL